MDLQTKVEEKITKPISKIENPMRLLLGVVIAALVLGTLTGYTLTTKGSSKVSPLSLGTAKKPAPSDPSEYTEGTHMLIRQGGVPVALTSSVVDLSIYEGKKVKVFGETQKALKEGWLMDVGKVEEIK